MASAARDLYYDGTSAVYGNLAHSLEREVLEHDLRHAGKAPRRQETAVAQPKVRSLSETQARPRQSVSVLSVLGFCAIAALAIVMLMSYIELTKLSADVVSLKSQLGTLETEHVTLTTQYEQLFDRASVKEAAEAAGMSKPSSSQIYYIDLSDGDNAVVYQKSDPGILSRLFTSLSHGIYTVVEYFD